MKIFHSIQVNGKTIDWERLCGEALGVQKYTKTHVSGGGENSSVSSRIETITEFDIVQQNGKETHFQISGDRIRVRDGQKVSILSCYSQGKSLPNCIFINHDRQEWDWGLLSGGSYGFSLPLEISGFTKERLIIGLRLGGIFVIVSPFLFYFFSVDSSVITFIFPLIFILFILFIVIQQIVLRLTWKKIQPEVEKMVRYIM